MKAQLHRLAALLVALAALSALGAPIDANAAGGRRLTLLRVELSTTSDWASITFDGISARVQRTVEMTAGAHLWTKPSEWTLVPTAGQPARAVIDFVASPALSESVLKVSKGMGGTATARLLTRNGSNPALVSETALASNHRSTNEVKVTLDARRLGVGDLEVPPIDTRRLTLAFYYPWFNSGAPSEWSIAPDKPTGAYDAGSASHVATMVSQAAAAGINGFAISWYGGPHGAAVDTVLAAAAARPGFVVSPLVELPSMMTTGALGRKQFDPIHAANVTRQFFERAPVGSTLTHDGRPVLFAFGMWDLSSTDWKAYTALLQDLNPFIIGERSGVDYPVDGLYQYDPNIVSTADLQARTDRAVDTSRLTSVIDPSVRQLLWAASVGPGFDNRASASLLKRRYTSRDGGARYDQTWAIALDSQPDWVLVTSWNEWYEQTHIAPGTRTGSAALEQTSGWTSRFQNG